MPTQREVSNRLQPFPPQLKRHVDLVKERWASSWCLDQTKAFISTKGNSEMPYAFDMVGTCLIYPGCCGKAFSTDHAMICHMGGFATIRHNELRDILLTTNVVTEPHLQSLSGETFRLTSVNTSDGARLDVYEQEVVRTLCLM
jgi:hypothetical protein